MRVQKNQTPGSQRQAWAEGPQVRAFTQSLKGFLGSKELCIKELNGDHWILVLRTFLKLNSLSNSGCVLHGCPYFHLGY